MRRRRSGVAYGRRKAGESGLPDVMSVQSCTLMTRRDRLIADPGSVSQSLRDWLKCGPLAMAG